MTTTPRRRLTAIPPGEALSRVPEAAPRSRRRVVGANAEQAEANTLATTALRIYNAKIAADQAVADYEALRKEGQAALVSLNRQEFTLDSEANRPAFQIKLASKAISTIDPAKFAAMVTQEEFIQCVSVKATDAKRFVGDARLEAITTTAQGATYLDCRIKGKARGE